MRAITWLLGGAARPGSACTAPLPRLRLREPRRWGSQEVFLGTWHWDTWLFLVTWTLGPN